MATLHGPGYTFLLPPRLFFVMMSTLGMALGVSAMAESRGLSMELYLLCQTRWCPCIDIMPSKPPPVLEPSLGTPRRHRSQAAQLAELYWMSLTRDVPFSKYGEDEDTIAAAGKSHSMPRTRSTRLATACWLLRHFLHASAA